MEIALTYTHTRNDTVFITELDGIGDVYRMVWPLNGHASGPLPYIFTVDSLGDYCTLPKNWTVV